MGAFKGFGYRSVSKKEERIHGTFAHLHHSLVEYRICPQGTLTCILDADKFLLPICSAQTLLCWLDDARLRPLSSRTGLLKCKSLKEICQSHWIEWKEDHLNRNWDWFRTWAGLGRNFISNRECFHTLYIIVFSVLYRPSVLQICSIKIIVL